MSDNITKFFRINEPHVVHETIDGEAILLNLKTGNYYSVEWPGTLVWDLLNKTGDVNAIKNAFLKAVEKDNDQIINSLNTFFRNLQEEELIVGTKKSTPAQLEINESLEQEIQKAVSNLQKLTLNKYTDMKDMLLLDPIHDVDEKGWPEPKKESKKEK